MPLNYPTGIQGAAGATGATGPIGNVGPAGPLGAQGPTGPTGLVPGPVGSISTSVGPTGATGDVFTNAHVGITGPQGPIGTSPTGPQGPEYGATSPLPIVHFSSSITVFPQATYSDKVVLIYTGSTNFVTVSLSAFLPIDFTVFIRTNTKTVNISVIPGHILYNDVGYNQCTLNFNNMLLNPVDYDETFACVGLKHMTQTSWTVITKFRVIDQDFNNETFFI